MKLLLLVSLMGKRTQRKHKRINKAVFPKKTDFREISGKEVLHVQHFLDNRPRKTLDYLTPSEVFNLLKPKTNICTYS